MRSSSMAPFRWRMASRLRAAPGVGLRRSRLVGDPSIRFIVFQFTGLRRGRLARGRRRGVWCPPPEDTIMKASLRYTSTMALAAAAVFMTATAQAQTPCQGLPTQAQLKTALAAAVSAETSGLNNHMWATIVNRDGVVCAVAFSGTARSSQVAI